MAMKMWNCRFLEKNGEGDLGPWSPISAGSAGEAAQGLCATADAWEAFNWQNGDDALVEVEEFGGESGVHRMRIAAYDVLNFSATPDEEA